MSPLCLLFLVLPLVSAQTFKLGPCPSPSVQSNFTLQQYLGRWYMIQKLQSFRERGRCVEANFFAKSDGSSTTLVRFSQIAVDKVETIEGTIHPNIIEPAKLGISYPYVYRANPWWVLATDYSTVSAVYICYDFLHIFHIDFAYIIGRTRSLPPDVVQEAKKVFRGNKIDISRMVAADQSGCGDEGGGHGIDHTSGGW